MELRIKAFGIIATLYLAPSLSPKGLFTWWPGNHTSYDKGIVVRALWLGFVARWSKVQKRYYDLPFICDGEFDH